MIVLQIQIDQRTSAFTPKVIRQLLVTVIDQELAEISQRQM
jgi:hypothetical protein